MQVRAMSRTALCAAAVAFAAAVFAGAVPAAAEVSVIRGQVPEPAEEPVAPHLARVKAGKQVWFIDYHEETLTACVLEHTTDLGERDIRCFEDVLFPEETLLVTD